MTVHLEQNWDAATDYLRVHECAPALFDAPRGAGVRRRLNTNGTAKLYMGQGPGDPRYIRRSTRPGYITIEQMAAVLGVTAGTARDRVLGRRGRIGVRLGNTIFVTHEEALLFLRKEWHVDC